MILFVVYVMGAYLTTVLGGDGYFHLGAFSIFTFGLIVFDFRTEKLEILIGIPLITLSFIIGELGLFNAPDFSDHSSIQLMRFSNIFSLVFINSIFTVFILRLSNMNEDELSIVLKEKDELLFELNQAKLTLEEKVKIRTAEISAQSTTLNRQNEENEILLKEIHHRVKNNLQIIVSLINLQLSKLDNPTIEAALRETQSRVLSMSLVHQKMYQNSNFKEIELSQYIEELVENVRNLYPNRIPKNILTIQEDIKVEISIAIPLGLIINEIVSNFFKHCAHIDHSSFSINLVKSHKHYLFKYSDNGNGFPTQFDHEKSDSLGIQLIDSLAEQIDGTLHFYNENGAVYEIKILANSND